MDLFKYTLQEICSVDEGYSIKPKTIISVKYVATNFKIKFIQKNKNLLCAKDKDTDKKRRILIQRGTDETF